MTLSLLSTPSCKLSVAWPFRPPVHQLADATYFSSHKTSAPVRAAYWEANTERLQLQSWRNRLYQNKSAITKSYNLWTNFQKLKNFLKVLENN